MLIIFAIFVMLINPLLAIPFAFRDYLESRRPAPCALCISFAMGYLAFYSESRYIGDLERYIQLLDKYREVPFFKCFDIFYSRLYLMDIFFWICSRFSNPRMLAVMVALVCYYCVLWIVLDFSREMDSDDEETKIITISVLCIIPFYSFIGAARSSVSIVLGAVALYRDVIKKKHDVLNLLLYLAPVFIHQAGIVAVLVKIIDILPGKAKKIITIAAMIILVCIGSGLFFFPRLTMFKEGIIGSAVDKVFEYSEFGTQQYSAWAIAVRNGLFPRVRKIFFALPLVSIVLVRLHLTLNVEEDTSLSFIISSLIIGMFFFPTEIYLRFIMGFMDFIILGVYSIIRPHDILVKTYAFAGLLLQCYTFFESVPYDVFFTSAWKGIWGMLGII